jgi:hypothetical protein
MITRCGLGDTMVSRWSRQPWMRDARRPVGRRRRRTTRRRRPSRAARSYHRASRRPYGQGGLRRAGGRGHDASGRPERAHRPDAGGATGRDRHNTPIGRHGSPIATRRRGAIAARRRGAIATHRRAAPVVRVALRAPPDERGRGRQPPGVRVGARAPAERERQPGVSSSGGGGPLGHSLGRTLPYWAVSGRAAASGRAVSGGRPAVTRRRSGGRRRGALCPSTGTARRETGRASLRLPAWPPASSPGS